MSALEQAIRDASHGRLVQAMLQVKDRCIEACPKLEEELLVDQFDSDASSVVLSDKENVLKIEDAPGRGIESCPPPKKQKRKRTSSDAQSNAPKRKLFETCIRCKAEFNVKDNEHDSCVYHPGKLEVNDEHEIWEDHWECTFGPCEDYMDESPERCLWSCCKLDGTQAGCDVAKHQRKKT